ncbi:4Fe-4S binding protein [Candidatus Woesearchaeota archaeon]|nr:4Fe-4S binding protein [Candidatus Woesearchaeota archaeon]
MLKITPYLGILVLIISIAGLWYPKLGYFLVLVFAAILAISPFRGRWFCGNLCPRGSFNDFWIGKISKNRKIPESFKKMKIRIPIFVLFLAIMVYRLMLTQGIVDLIGMVFVIACISTTLIAILLGTFISPRTWCTFCPMGTLQRIADRKMSVLKVDKEMCTDCRLCTNVCPMQIEVNVAKDKPDCIRCNRCVEVCPKDALKFS